jgi:hypothetical protein
VHLGHDGGVGAFFYHGPSVRWVLDIAWASGIAVILHLVWHWRLRWPWR